MKLSSVKYWIHFFTLCAVSIAYLVLGSSFNGAHAKQFHPNLVNLQKVHSESIDLLGSQANVINRELSGKNLQMCLFIEDIEDNKTESYDNPKLPIGSVNSYYSAFLSQKNVIEFTGYHRFFKSQFPTFTSLDMRIRCHIYLI